MSDDRSKIAELEARVASLEHDLQELAAVASHDLMEPARTIGGFLQLLEKLCGNRLGDEERKYLGFAVDGAERMRDMLTAMLSLSRVRTHCNAFAPVSMETLFEATCERMRSRIDALAGRVTHDPLPVVQGDATQLVKVVSALLENALTYSGDDAPDVHVNATVESDGPVPMATFAVRDCGIGIAPKFHEAVFVMFRRLHSRTKDSGVGAGLAISRRIIEHHGGSMWVESTEGEGSTFFFSLPIPVDGQDD